MPHLCEVCLAVILSVMVAVGPEVVDGGAAYWNEADPRVGAGVGSMTAAEDALRVLRSVPLTELSAGQRRHVKRRILAVLGLDHAPRPGAERIRRGRRAAIAAYMMSLYAGVSEHDDEDHPSTWNSVPQDWTDSGLLTSDWRQLSSAETVISFVNQGAVYNKCNNTNGNWRRDLDIPHRHSLQDNSASLLHGVGHFSLPPPPLPIYNIKRSTQLIAVDRLRSVTQFSGTLKNSSPRGSVGLRLGSGIEVSHSFQKKIHVS